MAEAVLYDNIINVMEEYLGPASQRFIDRQITFHLHKKPHEINSADIERLSDWIKVSMSLLTDNQKDVQDCIEKLVQLI